MSIGNMCAVPSKQIFDTIYRCNSHMVGVYFSFCW